MLITSDCIANSCSENGILDTFLENIVTMIEYDYARLETKVIQIRTILHLPDLIVEIGYLSNI